MKNNLSHQKKHRAREVALQLLYSLEITKQKDLSKMLDNFEFEDESLREEVEPLVRGVSENLTQIENMINRNVTGWRSDRMVAVDRAAIRIALYEGLVSRTVPVAVAISEAVELAKVFGTDDSGKFVNGVLAKVFRALETHEQNGE